MFGIDRNAATIEIMREITWDDIQSFSAKQPLFWQQHCLGPLTVGYPQATLDLLSHKPSVTSERHV